MKWALDEVAMGVENVVIKVHGDKGVIVKEYVSSKKIVWRSI